MAKLTAPERARSNAAKISLEKWTRLRDEQLRFLKGIDALKEKLEREIQDRLEAVVKLRARLDGLPGEVYDAEVKVSTYNRHIENAKATHNKAISKGRMRKQKMTLKEKLRKVEADLRKMSDD